VALWGVAASALVGLVSATPQVARAQARAATPSVSSQVAHALAREHSFQMTMQIATSGAGQHITETSTAIMVRRGTTLRLDIAIALRRADRMSTVEEVFTGTHLCARTSGGGAWSCGALPGSALAHLQVTNLDQLAAAFGLSQQYEPAGQETRQGQPCLRYQFSLSARGMREQGTLWVARATPLPVEEDMVGTLAPRTGAPPLVMRTTLRWSRWNDQRLSIPSVPAS
jgi:hypothetical protein